MRSPRQGEKRAVMTFLRWSEQTALAMGVDAMQAAVGTAAAAGGAFLDLGIWLSDLLMDPGDRLLVASTRALDVLEAMEEDGAL